MTAMDLFKFNACNLDHLTETYNIGFYLEYLSKWPHLCKVIEGPDGNIEGYLLAKLEESPNWAQPSEVPYSPSTNKNLDYLPWHGHITALSISPLARRLGHASSLTTDLERTCDAHSAWFVDLFVREDNKVAQVFYKGLGYSVFRRVVGYYNDSADAFDMRKPLSRDINKDTVRAGGEDFRVDPSSVW